MNPTCAEVRLTQPVLINDSVPIAHAIDTFRTRDISILSCSFAVFAVCIRRIYGVQQGWLWKKNPVSTNLAMFMVFNACEQQSNQIGVIKFSLTCPKQIHASWQVPKLYFIRCLAPLLVKQPWFSIWTGFLARFLEILSSNFDTVLDAQLCCQNRNFASFPWRYITLVIRKSWSSRLRFGSCREHLC